MSNLFAANNSSAKNPFNNSQSSDSLKKGSPVKGTGENVGTGNNRMFSNSAQQVLKESNPQINQQYKFKKEVSFSELHRKLKNNFHETIQEIQGGELSQWKTILQFNLEYFQPSETKTREYQTKHEQKDNFGFTKVELGGMDERFKAKQIDNFWKEFVKNFTKIVGVNELLVCQYIRKYIFINQIYQNKLLTNASITNALVLRPNMDFIRELYRITNENPTVDTESEFYVQVFSEIFSQYEQEFRSLLDILLKIAENPKSKLFRNLIKNDLHLILWKKYKEFSFSSLKNKVKENEEVKDAFRYYYKIKFEERFTGFRFYILKKISDLLTYIFQNKEKYLKNELKLHQSQMIKFIDQDIFSLENEQQDYLSKEKQFFYIQKSLKIILFSLDTQLFKGDKNRQIKETIASTKARHLQAFRILFYISNLREKEKKIVQYWEIMPESLEWMMIQPSWKSWLVIFLQFKKTAQIIQCDIVFSLILILCKNIVAKNDIFISDKREDHTIYRFIKEGLEKKQVKFFLPTLTKCLGDKIQTVDLTINNLIGLEKFRVNVIEKIYRNLQISDRQNLSKGASLLSIRHDKSGESPLLRTESLPEQQLKFICRVICLHLDDIASLEEKLFGTPVDKATGLQVSIFVLSCFQKIHEYNVAGLKCLRYLVETIDKLFVNSFTRNTLVMALCLVWRENGQANTTQIQEIINFCITKEKHSEEERQSQKLREVFSIHLNHILKFSTHINEYFPVSCNPITAQPPSQIYQYLVKRNHHPIYEWFLENNQCFEYKNSPWFYSLLTLLQGDSLLPHDFDSIRLILEKMRYEETSGIQYENLIQIEERLNEGQINKIIERTLQPILYEDSMIKYGKPPIFGIVNRNLFTIEQGEYNFFYKYKSFRKINQKKRSHKKKKEENVLGNISGCFQLLHTVLKVANENKSYPILEKLSFYQFCLSSLTQFQTIFHYKCEIHRTQSYSSPRNQFAFETEVNGISVNMIQTIASFIHLETLLRYPFKEHKNRKIQYSPYCVSDHTHIPNPTTILQNYPIEQFLHENWLQRAHNQLTFKNENSIGIGGVLRIFMQLLLMGKSKLLTKCLINHNLEFIYSYRKQDIDEVRMCKVFFKSIIGQLHYNHFLSLEQKQIIYQFFSLCLNKSSQLSNYIIKGNTELWRQVVRKDLAMIRRSHEIILVNRIAMFVSMLTEKRGTFGEEIDNIVRFPTNIIYDILKKIDKIKILTLEAEFHGIELFNNLISFKMINISILFESTLYLCLQMIKDYLFHQSKQILSNMMAYVLDLTPIIFQQLPHLEETVPFALKLLPFSSLKIKKNENISYLNMESIQQFLSPLYSCSPHGYGRSYQYNSTLAYHRLQILKNKQEIIKQMGNINRINVTISLHHCQEKVIANLMYFYQVILSTGRFGHVLSNSLEELCLKDAKWTRFEQKFILAKLKNFYKDSGTNKINSLQILGRNPDEAFENMISISKILIQYFQLNSIRQYKNDTILNTISLFIKNIILYFKTIGENSSKLNKFKQLLDYLLICTCVRFEGSLRVYLIFLQSLVNGYHLSLKVYDYDQIQTICERIEMIFFKTSKNYSDQTIDENIFLVSLVLTNIIRGDVNPNKKDLKRKLTIQTITILCHKFVNQHLKITFDSQCLCILKLINTILQDEDCKPEFVGNYIRLLSMSPIDDPVLNYHVLESLSISHDQAQKYDIGSIGNIFLYTRRRIPELDIEQDQISSKKKSLKKEIYGSFSEILDANLLQKDFSLSIIAELKAILMFLCIVTEKKQYWLHQTYSRILQKMFTKLISIKCLDSLVIMVIENKLVSIGQGEKYLASITLPPENIEDMQKNDENKQKYQKSEKIDLLQFTMQIQTCWICHFYMQALCCCLQNSEHLSNFYSKIVLSARNELTELIWEEMSIKIQRVIDFLNFLVEGVEGNSYDLSILLKMYTYASKNTDLGYDTDFLSASLLSDFSSPHEYYQFLLDTLSKCYDTVLLLTSTWSKNDWKAELNWLGMREQLQMKCLKLIGKYHRVLMREEIECNSLKQMQYRLDRLIKREREGQNKY